MKGIERRKNVRVPFSVESKVKLGDKEFKGIVLNLSFHGMLLEIKEPAPVDSILEVNMVISSGETEREVKLPGTVIRSDKKGTALKLMKLNHDSLNILKDILVEKYSNPDQIVSEFCRFITESNIQA